MDIDTAIAIINASELGNKVEVAAAIAALKEVWAGAQTQVTSLAEEKARLVENNATLLGQKAAAKSRVAELEKQMSELVSAAGDDEDEATAIANLKTLAEDLKKAKADLEAMVTERDSAIAAKADLQGEITYRDASAKLGVESVVLQKLLELPADRLIVEGDAVKVKGEGEGAAALTFDEYVEAQPDAIKRMVNLARGSAGDGGGDRSGGGDTTKGKGPKAPPSGEPKNTSVASVVSAMGFKGPPTAAKQG